MKYIIFLSLLILTFSSQAAPLCSKNGTTVIYTNGVTTTKRNANIALGKIKALALNSQIDLRPEKVLYDLAYNYEESISRDFLEAAVQRFPAGFLRSLGVTNSYAAYMEYLNGGLADAVYVVALNSITEKLLEIQSDWLINYRSGSLYLQTVREIKGHYETALNNGERVFAISHSQGGLFMSDSFDQTSFTDKQKYFSGFQIASPLSDEMNSHFGYATHDKDRLINFVRGTVGALSANVSAPLIINNSYEGISDYAIDFVINHGIVTTYLNDSTIKSQVIPKLIEAAQLLESNCPKAVINYTKNNLAVNFDSTDPQNPSVTGLTYSWNFDDGQTANTTSKTLPHNYSVAGTYIVSLTVTDSFGFSDTAQISLVVKSAIGNLTICNGGNPFDDMNFSLSSADFNSSFSLKHIYNFNTAGNYIGATCECKILNVPVNSSIAVQVNATQIASPGQTETIQILPYSGTINVSSSPQILQWFTVGDVTLPPGSTGQLWKVVKGIYYSTSCNDYVYK